MCFQSDFNDSMFKLSYSTTQSVRELTASISTEPNILSGNIVT
jgi:hypothetical protein